MAEEANVLSWLRRHKANIRDIWSPISTIVANILVAAALMVAVLTYCQQQRQTEVEASLSYVERFSDGAILAARNALFDSWKGYDFTTLSSGLSSEAAEALVTRVMAVEQAGGNDLLTPITEIATFIDGAQICIEQSICNSDVINRQMGDYARTFYCLYRSVIDGQRRRGQMSGYGTGLERIAALAGGCNA